MKITSEILRSEAARIFKLVNEAFVDGSSESYLYDALFVVAQSLDEIHLSIRTEDSTYHLSNNFQLETEHPPVYAGPLGPLGPHENDPVRLWAEIWKLRAEARGPYDFETWRDAAVAEKMHRVKAERELKELREQISMVLDRPNCGTQHMEPTANQNEAIWGASTHSDLHCALDAAHELSGPPHERISELIRQRDRARDELRALKASEPTARDVLTNSERYLELRKRMVMTLPPLAQGHLSLTAGIRTPWTRSNLVVCFLQTGAMAYTLANVVTHMGF
jgi:hypothetical protein